MPTKAGILLDKLFDIEAELFRTTEHLICVNWDSNSLKKNVKSLVKQKLKVMDELIKLYKKSEMVQKNKKE